MITLTDSASAHILELERENAAEGQMLRVFVKAGGCSGLEYGMSFDHQKEKDRIFESKGIRLLVDEESLQHLKGSEIHFDDGLNGKGFDIRNPNSKTTCGCGRSFN